MLHSYTFYVRVCKKILYFIGLGFYLTKSLILLAFSQKSDNSFKNAFSKTTKIGLGWGLGLHNKKAPRKVHFNKWCTILCSYRTQDYEEFKDLSRQIETFEIL